ncbi:MAG: lysophospholipase [Parvibaculum sp.]|nr:lysophospholipase [Parvibaculum sp.]
MTRLFRLILGSSVVAGLIIGCAPRLMATGDPLYPPKMEPSSTAQMMNAAMSDGARLPMRVWSAENPHAIIIGLHGMNDYSNAFDMPGKWFATRGVTTFAYDQRGFGQAPGRGLWAGPARMADDLNTVIALVHKQYPGLPVYIMGESMGGAVAMRAFTTANPPDVDGIILAAPAVWGWRAMNAFYETVLWMSAHLMPSMTMTGGGLKIQASDNIEMLKALGRDPLVIKATEIGTIYGLVELMDEAAIAAPRITVPVLLMYGAHDQVVPPVPVGDTLRDMQHSNVNVTSACYKNGYHILLRDLERETVWKDVESWMLASEMPLPSGAQNLEPCPALTRNPMN